MPAGAVKWLPAAIAHAEATAEPGGPKMATVLLNRLWAVCPMPGDDALDVWVETLAKYPADLVKAAIDAVIATRTWERDPPLPGQVVAHLREDYAARLTKRNRLRVMRDKAAVEAAHQRPAGKSYADMTDDERAAFDARMERLKAGLRAKRMPTDELTDDDLAQRKAQALAGLEAAR